MKTKEDVIKEAYGEYWEEIKTATCNSTGWVMSDYFDCRDYDIEVDIDDENYLWRAKSLQGVEKNNGWIKIESEADLPTKEQLYWLSSEKGFIKDSLFPLSSIKIKYINGTCTHYQPVQTPNDPVF